MPFALYVDIIPAGGGPVSVTHIFFGETEDECRQNFQAHAKACEFLTPAIEEGRVEEELEEIDAEDWPEYVDEDEEPEET
jgi:hypothetical protein